MCVSGRMALYLWCIIGRGCCSISRPDYLNFTPEISLTLLALYVLLAAYSTLLYTFLLFITEISRSF